MERRTTEGYRLRVYMDALQSAKSMTTDQWTTTWAEASPIDYCYVSQANWILSRTVHYPRGP